MNPNLLEKAEILIVRIWLWLLNFILAIIRKILFPWKIKNPKNILIYKLGNIGDIVCAMPAMYTVKENFPDARITLLTSPGKRGAIGAKDFLDGASYLDNIRVYYSDDISTFSKIFSMISILKKEKYDLFIQLPDDWVKFKTLIRNQIFAKIIGVKSALGFYIRTSQMFKKTQVDFTSKKTESVALLDILVENGIKKYEIKFEFPKHIFESYKNNAEIDLLKKENDIILGICMGGGTEDKKWPIEKFIEVFRDLKLKYTKMGVIFFGGLSEIDSIEKVAKTCELRYINFAGKSIKESILAIKSTDAFLTNDTGPMHIAAAFGIPIIALFSTRSVFGSWFPYGKNNFCLYKKFLKCDYLKEDCVKKSIVTISVEEVIGACNEVFYQIIS